MLCHGRARHKVRHAPSAQRRGWRARRSAYGAMRGSAEGETSATPRAGAQVATAEGSGGEGPPAHGEPKDSAKPCSRGIARPSCTRWAAATRTAWISAVREKTDWIFALLA